MAFIVVWGAFFLSATLLFSSRANEDLLSLQKVMKETDTWESYESSQRLYLEGEEEIRITSLFHQEPYLEHVVSQVRLTEDEDFKFEVYFNPEVIYIHTLNTSQWNKTDYTNSIAGELEGMKEPMVFWNRMLNHAQKIRKEQIADGEDHYILTLNPFRDEVHGFQFNEIASAQMEAWVTNKPNRLNKIMMVMHLKPNILRRYNQITYTTSFSNINKAHEIELPEDAQEAKAIN